MTTECAILMTSIGLGGFCECVVGGARTGNDLFLMTVYRADDWCACVCELSLSGSDC